MVDDCPAASNATANAVAAAPPMDDAIKNRLRESEREFEQMRQQRGMKLIDEAREFNRANPGDPWAYKDQLEKIVNSYRGTPAAEQVMRC